MEVLGKAVLIKPDELPETTKGGIAIPKTAKEMPQTGTIVDCGYACTDAQKGKHIHYPRKAASVIMLDEVEYHFIVEDRILYIE